MDEETIPWRVRIADELQQAEEEGYDVAALRARVAAEKPEDEAAYREILEQVAECPRRPFPFEELRQAVKDAELIIVLDRCVSLGGPGPVASEVKAALYPLEKRPKVVNFVGGMGGRDIKLDEFEHMYLRGKEIAERGQEVEFETVGIRE